MLIHLEVFAILIGVIVVMGPFDTQTEQFVQRYQSTVDTSISVAYRDRCIDQANLKSPGTRDCALAHSRVLQLQQGL